MKALLITLFIGLSSLLSAQHNEVVIEFNKNLDFFGYLVELGEPGDNDPNHPVSIILKQYSHNRTNPLLAKIYEHASDFTYAMFVEFFYNDLPELPITSSHSIDDLIENNYPLKSNEDKATLKHLMLLVNRFYLESQFESIWNKLEPYRNGTYDNLKNNLPPSEIIEQIESFYGQNFDSYKIVPSITIWPTAGWGLKNSELSTATFILGPLQNNYDFTDASRFENLAIHEFGHSFVNHVVLANSKLIEASQSFYPDLAEKMTPQGYNDWEGCIIEHYVRAGEIIIPQLLNIDSTNTDLLKHYVQDKGFIYLPFIIERLKLYRLTENLSYEESVSKSFKDLIKHYN